MVKVVGYTIKNVASIYIPQRNSQNMCMILEMTEAVFMLVNRILETTKAVYPWEL